MEIIILVLLVLSGIPFVAGILLGYHLGKRKNSEASPPAPQAVHPLSRKPPPDPAEPTSQDRARHPPKSPATSEEEPPARPMPEHYAPPRAPSEPPGRAGDQASRSTSTQVASRTQSPTSTAQPSTSNKERDESRLINVALYIGGLVLTVAALAFVAVMQSPQVTATALIVAYLLFAGVGFWLAARVEILKPAGLALFGTSLALLAVAALPVNEAFIGNGLATWLLASLTGLVIYGAASVHLDSRVLGYLVIPFLYSSVVSSTAVLQQPLIWTLVGTILLSAAVQVGVIALGDRVPQVLARPFGQLHWFVVPAVLAAAVLLSGRLGSFDYAILFGVAGLHYGLTAIQAPSPQLRPIYTGAARLLVLASVISVLAGLRIEGSAFLGSIALWLAVHFIAVALVPQLSGVTGESQNQKIPLIDVEPAHFRRGDITLSLLLALAAALLAQSATLLQPQLDAAEHLWAGSGIAATLASGTVHLLGKSGQIAQAVPQSSVILRIAMAAGLLVAVPHHPWYAVFWAGTWLLAERVLSRPPGRFAWQRGLSLLVVALLGWSIGGAVESDLLGLRLMLLGVLTAAAASVVLLLVRIRPVSTAEPWAYWTITAAAAIAGTWALGLLDWLQPLYAVAAMAIIYSLLLLILHTELSEPHAVPAADQMDRALLGRIVGFLAASLIVILSIEWESLRPGLLLEAGDVGQTNVALWTLLILAGLLGAELLTGAQLSQLNRGAGGAGLRHWLPIHLVAHAAWLAGLYLIATANAAAGLWWITSLILAATCVVYLRLVGIAGSAHSIADVYAARIYAGAVAVMVVLSVTLNVTVTWWALAVTAASAAVIGLLAVLLVPHLAEVPWAVPLYLAAGVYLLVGSLWSTAFQGFTGISAATSYAAAAVTVLVLLVLVLSALPRYAGLAAGQVFAGTSAALITIAALVTLRVGTPSGSRSVPDGANDQLVDQALDAGLALLVVAALYLLLIRGLQHRSTPRNIVMQSRGAAYLAAALVLGMAVDWAAAWQGGGQVAAGAENVAAAVWTLGLLGALTSAEVLAARAINGTVPGGGLPIHRWVPLHLSVNALWLGLVNLALALTGATGELWWFTAVAWALSCVAFLRAASRSGQAADRLPARSYGAAVGVLAVLAGLTADLWWAQLAAALAAAGTAAAALYWGSRLPEVPFAAPLYAAGSAALVTAILLRAAFDHSAVGGHPSVVGYLSGTGAFAAAAGCALWGRWLFDDQRARGQNTLVSGALALLASLAPILTSTYAVAPLLAWLVPAMHVMLAAAALSHKQLRIPVGLIAALVLPVSGLFAWSMWTPLGSADYAVAGLLMLSAVLTAEAILLTHAGQPAGQHGQEAAAGNGTAGLDRWSRAYYLCAGAITVMLALLGLTAEGVVVQAAPLAGGVILLVAGLMRSSRIGVYWGASVVVLSVLWALRGLMFLFLIVLGGLIIAAAIWRLLVIQRNHQQKQRPTQKLRQR